MVERNAIIQTTTGDWRQLPSGDTLSGAGRVLQAQVIEDATYRSSTNTIPTDNTVPQNTEGSEWASVSFTPLFTTSTIYIIAIAFGGHTSSDNWSISVFESGSSTAIAAASSTTEGNTIHHSVNACVGTVSSWGQTSRTVSARFGPDTGGTAYLNGDSTARAFGGATGSTLIVLEVA